MALAASRRLAAEVPALASVGLRGLATKAAGDKAVAAAQAKGLQIKEEDIPTTIAGGQAFPNDLRSTSALGVGDGIKTHTGKWLQVRARAPTGERPGPPRSSGAGV